MFSFELAGPLGMAVLLIWRYIIYRQDLYFEDEGINTEESG